ncbi:MAG: response regulator [Anaerolineales bacterium]|nr:response regulator [Anaerolineales bacterium]
MSEQLNVLVIEDQRHDYNLAKYALTRGEELCSVSWIKRGEDALQQLSNHNFDVAVLDYKLPGMNGLEIFQAMKAHEVNMPTIFVTGSSTVTTAVEALKLGAQDFLVKDSSGKYLDLLPIIVRKAYEDWQNEQARKQAEAALRESDERLRSTIASLDDLVFVLDEDGSFLSYFQPPSKLDAGQAPEFFLGKSYEDVLPPHVARLLTQALESALISNSVQQFDYALSSASNTYWFNAKLSLRCNSNGQYAGATMVVRDITDRQLTTAMLQQKTAQLEALRQIGLELASELNLDSLLQSIVDSAIVLLNGTMGSLYLLTNHGQKLQYAVTGGESNVTWQSNLAMGEGIGGKVWESGEPIILNHFREWEGYCKTKDAPQPVAFIGVPIQWQDRLLGVLTIAARHPIYFSVNDSELLTLFAMQAAVALHNVQLLREIQQNRDELEDRVQMRTSELTEANKRLQSLHDLKIKFIHDITHELRTPISNLKLHLDLLNRGKTEKREKYLKVITDQTNRLEIIFEQIVELTRLTTEVNEEIKLVDLNEIIGQAFLSYCIHETDTPLKTQFEPDKSLPHISANRKQLFALAQQLIKNAVNYTHEGYIVVKTFADNEYVCIQVEDTGIGISEEDLPYIFDKFYRGKKVGQFNQPGAGIGLSVVKEIANLHAGEVTVYSQDGIGSCFIVRLPIK